MGLTKKIAKRKLMCRICGEIIPKSNEYWVLRYMEGPYLRRMVLCRKCAVKEAENIVRAWIDRVFWNQMCVERSNLDNMKVFDAIAYGLVLGVEKWYECRRDPHYLSQRAERAFGDTLLGELVNFRKVAEDYLRSIDRDKESLKVRWV